MNGSTVEIQGTASQQNAIASELNRHYISKPGKHKRDLPKHKNTVCRIKVKYVDPICDAVWDGNYFWAKTNNMAATINIDPFWIVWWEETNEVDETPIPNTKLYPE